MPWVPANTTDPWLAYASQAPPVDFSNFYGLTARDYEDTRTDLATARRRARLRPALTLRNLLRYGRTRRDSVITAPRFVSVNAEHTDINRQLQSRDMTDTIVANQTDLDRALRDGRGRARAGRRPRASDARARRTTCAAAPTAPLADLFDPNPDAPYPGPDHAHGRRQRRARPTRVGLRVRHRASSGEAGR